MGSRCRNNRDASKSIDAAFPIVKDTGAPFRKFVQMRGSAHGCRVWGGNRRYDSPASAYHWLLASSRMAGGATQVSSAAAGNQSMIDLGGSFLGRITPNVRYTQPACYSSFRVLELGLLRTAHSVVHDATSEL